MNTIAQLIPKTGLCCGASARTVWWPFGSSEVSRGLYFDHSRRDPGPHPRQDLCHTYVHPQCFLLSAITSHYVLTDTLTRQCAGATCHAGHGASSIPAELDLQALQQMSAVSTSMLRECMHRQVMEEHTADVVVTLACAAAERDPEAYTSSSQQVAHKHLNGDLLTRPATHSHLWSTLVTMADHASSQQ